MQYMQPTGSAQSILTTSSMLSPAPAIEREVTPLPQIDRGRQAWSFVAAGFAIETLLWGGLFSTGVFLKYYATTEVSRVAANA
jgi:hypothetical protein